MSTGRMATPRSRMNRRRPADITDMVPAVADAAYWARLRRIAAVRLELRFGPDSDVARMLGVTA